MRENYNTNAADKGDKGGSCNVTACQRPNSAFYFNKSTRRYYCAECAEKINWPGGRADTMALYGTPLLCELDDEPSSSFEIEAIEFPEPEAYCEPLPPQRTYAGPPIKGKKGRDKRW